MNSNMKDVLLLLLLLLPGHPSSCTNKCLQSLPRSSFPSSFENFVLQPIKARRSPAMAPPNDRTPHPTPLWPERGASGESPSCGDTNPSPLLFWLASLLWLSPPMLSDPGPKPVANEPRFASASSHEPDV